MILDEKIKNRKVKKGDMIKNTCHGCFNKEMKVYSVSKKSGIFVLCECLECDAVDDLFEQEANRIRGVIEMILDEKIKNRKVKKGDMIKNTCHGCFNKEMKVYSVSKKSGIFVLCECLECGAVDDLIDYD